MLQIRARRVYTLVMLIFLHVVIAIASVIYSTFVLARPSVNKFYFSYVMIGATILSGTYLIIINPSHMVQSCLMGIGYVGIVTFALVKARKKLAIRTSTSSF